MAALGFSPVAQPGQTDPFARLMSLHDKVAQASEGTSAVTPKMREAARNFESFYIQQFLELSQPKVDTSGLFYGGVGEEMFKHQLNEQVATAVTKRGGFGLSENIIRQMIQRQSAGNEPLVPPNAYAAQASTNGGQ